MTRRTAAAAAATLATVGTVAAADPAWALCPNCLGQTDALSPTMKILGGFLLIPTVIFFVVLRLIRKAQHAELQPPSA